jgi:hypothetical protein
MCVLIGAMVGFLRGWSREVVATAGVILALFIRQQFKEIIFDPLTAGASADARFYLYTGILLIVTFFAYQTPEQAAKISNNRLWGGNRRDNLTERVLGIFVGGFNAYLIFGSIWSFLEEVGYPFTPYFAAPPPGSPSDVFVKSGLLPLTWMVQGNLLTIVVIVLFLFVLITMI